jgi:acetyl esterase/lipase
MPHLLPRAFGLEHRPSSSRPFPPANPFPAALLDALAGYRYLVHTLGFRPRDVVVCGDSSGGQLALSLVRYLVLSRLPSLPPPGALVLLSPTGDWARTAAGMPGCALDANEPTDIVGVVLRCGYTARSILGRLPPAHVRTSPWLSPSSLALPASATEGGALFAGFPPTCVLGSAAEQIVDGIRVLKGRLAEAIGEEKVCYREWPHAFHNWVAWGFHEPERTEALEDIRRFLEGVYEE